MLVPFFCCRLPINMSASLGGGLVTRHTHFRRNDRVALYARRAESYVSPLCNETVLLHDLCAKFCLVIQEVDISAPINETEQEWKKHPLVCERHQKGNRSSGTPSWMIACRPLYRLRGYLYFHTMIMLLYQNSRTANHETYAGGREKRY